MMATIVENLAELETIRQNIRQALTIKGVPVPAGTPFSQYATKISEIAVNTGGPVYDSWERPADWLPLPLPTAREVYALVAVYPNGTSENTVNFSIGAYTGTPEVYTAITVELQVDYGDGTIQNYTPAHSDISIPFHVYDYNNPLLAGTETSAGYKQAILKVSVVPLNAFIHSVGTTSTNSLYPSNVLELSIGSAINVRSGPRYSRLLQHLLINNSYRNIDTYIDDNLLALTITGDAQADGITVNRFLGQELTLPTTGVPTAYVANNTIKSLIAISVDGYELYVEYCQLLDNLVSSYPYTYVTGVRNLKSVDLSSVDLSSVTTGSYLVPSFSGCSSLRRIVFPELLNVTQPMSLNGVFRDCSLLETCSIRINSFDVQTLTMFYGCISLRSVKFEGIHTIYNASQMFFRCVSLIDVEFAPNSLRYITNSGAVQSIFSECRAVRRLINFCPAFSCSIADLSLSAQALNRVYADLPTVIGQTINVTGNPGTSQPGHDPSIATSKGWTVTL